MTDATLLRWFGLSRVAFGLWLTLAPQKPGELWFGGTTLPVSSSSLLRSVGARDIGLGLGVATSPEHDLRWLQAGIIADIGDVAATALARNRLPTKNFLTGFLGALAYTAVGTVFVLRRKSHRQ